ncbi:MAG: hypothetical protein HOP37_05855 [Cyclobacteriaceae bacterium]|nr:hypothetical protein [Cyclobacteriaceae bacterium]
MGAVVRVLHKVLVKKFYERNVGLLFFVFYLMFGVVESNQLINYHRSLIYGVLTSPVFLMGVMGVWILYSAKYLQLVLSELAEPHNQFLKDYSRLGKSHQFWPMLLSVVMMDQPVLLYSVFIVGVGIFSQQYVAVFLVFVFHFARLVGCTWIVLRRINSLHERKATKLLTSIQWPWKKYFPFFYLGHFTNQLPLALLFTKSFSLFAIIGFMQITTDHYENRTALMGLLFGLMAHSVIIFESRRLEETYLIFVRGLPISMIKRFLFLSLFYGVLLIPELVLLAINHIVWFDLLFITLFAVFYLVYQHTRLFRGSLAIDAHTTFTFGLFLISFMLVLFKLYWLEAFVLGILGFYQYERDYYNFEASA